MAAKRTSGNTDPKGGRPLPYDGDSHAEAPPTRAAFSRLQRLVDELDKRVRQNRQDLDVQFQRLADLQAVVDRVQIAAGQVRARR